MDRLLESPHYGERWGRHWLDLARFAESEGFKADQTRPNVWRYRDYVIDSFNQDKPYDRFVQEQIAGDELWPGDPLARIATGFQRHYPDETNAANMMQRRQENLQDITDTVALTFMGMTVGCAKCHDHKFDPILQKDYYRLQAFFANTALDDESPMLSGEELRSYKQRKQEWEQATAEIRAQIQTILAPKKQEIIDIRFIRYPEDLQARLDAETVRDSALSVAGLLNTQAGGPSVFPPLPDGMPPPRGGWEVSQNSSDHYRRSVYVFVRRNSPYPMLKALDLPDTHESCARRESTITAPQALTYINSNVTMGWAQAFAGRVLETADEGFSDRVTHAYRLAYQRDASGDEEAAALAFLREHSGVIEKDGEGESALPTFLPADMSQADGAAFTDFAHTLINANEFGFGF